MTPRAPHHEVSGALRRRVMQAVEAEPRAPSPGPRPRPHLHSRPRRPSRRAVLSLAVAFAVVLVVAAARPGGFIPHGSGSRVIAAAVGDARLRIAGGAGELIVDHLPRTPPGRIYELWIQHGRRMPAPSTLFGVTSRGTADIGLPGELSGVTRVLVTLEPADGSAVPTTAPVIVAGLLRTD
jgi:Anti-sigma-K factor rskA